MQVNVEKLSLNPQGKNLVVGLKEGSKYNVPIVDKSEREVQQKYGRIQGQLQGGKGKKVYHQLKSLKKLDTEGAKLASNAEYLLPEGEGYLEGEGVEKVYSLKQETIVKQLPLTTASKRFDIDLPQLGPYCLDYTLNGSHMLIGGRKGHVALCDWKAGIVNTELQLKETVRCVKFLHNDTMFAVAQKKYLYLYDKNGIELHCLKQHQNVNQLDFLYYHFLLTSIGANGYLKYQDVSTGKLVQEIQTGLGRCDLMTQNQQNAVIHLGHTNGTVTLWSPNSSQPLIKMLCHQGPTQALTVDSTGRYMASAGLDGKLKVWDLRTYKVLDHYTTQKASNAIQFSQKGVLAVSTGSRITLWKDICTRKQSTPYLNHNCGETWVHQLQFCPYQDVLGFGHRKGFSSIIVPGSGEPNFDSLEVNLYQNVKQRQEAEIRSLLNKIPAETINLHTTQVGMVYNPELDLEDQAQKAELEANSKTVQVKHKMRGKSGSGNRFLRKKGLIQLNLKQLRTQHQSNHQIKHPRALKEQPSFHPPQTGSAINLFKPNPN